MVDVPEWRVPGQTFLECNRHMLESRYATDVVFVVGGKEGDGERISAHRYVLICRSPVFDAMLRWEKNTKNPICIEDAEPAAFNQMLRYIYCEESDIRADNVMAILYLSQKYMLVSLTAKCNEFLENNLNVHTVLPILDGSLIYDNDALTEKCMDIVQKRTDAVMTSEEFLGISSSTLDRILDCEQMACENETVVYTACLHWAEARCRERNIELNDRNKREVLGKMARKIRFAAMTFEEFADASGTSSFLTPIEKCQIYCDIASRRRRREVEQPAERFPSRPRNLMPHFTTDSPQEEDIICQRFTEIDESWNYESHDMDAISFRSDTDCLLAGIGLFGGDIQSSHQIKVNLQDDSGAILNDLQTTRLISDGNSLPIKIRFPSPSVIVAGKVYTLIVSMIGPPTFCGDGGQEVVTCEDITIHFSFSSLSTNATDVKVGQIPMLILKEPKSHLFESSTEESE